MIQKLIQYNHWSNDQWIDFVYRKSPEDPYPLRLANHLVKGERAWVQRIQGLEWNRDLWNIETKEELRELADHNYRFLSGLGAERLEERIAITRLSGISYRPLIGDILQHIFLHGAHHRGQLARYWAEASRKSAGRTETIRAEMPETDQVADPAAPETDYMGFCISFVPA